MSSRLCSSDIEHLQLHPAIPGARQPAWLYFSLNPRRCGVTMAVDGWETRNIQNFS
jgi:hypothetical protein